ncbi:MAG: DUF6364 family protein [Bryobacteraceae bacterium]
MCTHKIMLMNVTLSVNSEIIEKARKRAEAMGTSVNQLIREYLEQIAGQNGAEADAKEFERLSRDAQGDSQGWRFNRDELHERR